MAAVSSESASTQRNAASLRSMNRYAILSHALIMDFNKVR